VVFVEIVPGLLPLPTLHMSQNHGRPSDHIWDGILLNKPWSFWFWCTPCNHTWKGEFQL
jgi:hypothetical protein